MVGSGRSLLMTADAVGGIWTYAMELGRAMAARGWHVTVAVVGPAARADRRAAAEAAGMRLVHLDAEPEWLARDADEVARGGRALAALARESGADVVHLNHPALAADVAFEAPLLVVCHSCVATWWDAVRATPLPHDMAWQAALVGRGYRSAQALVAPSHAFAEATRRAYDLPEPPTVVHNGRDAGAVAAIQGSPGPTALTAGRLWDEGKDVATLDRAAALARVPVRAAGPTRGPNGATIALHHLEALGELGEPELRARLAERPIYVSAARYEPFGLAVLEAAQAGCALVLSDIASLRELWDGAALFVPPGDAAGFATALDALATDQRRRAELAATAARRARDFAVACHSDSMTAVYTSLLERAPSLGARVT